MISDKNIQRLRNEKLVEDYLDKYKVISLFDAKKLVSDYAHEHTAKGTLMRSKEDFDYWFENTEQWEEDKEYYFRKDYSKLFHMCSCTRYYTCSKDNIPFLDIIVDKDTVTFLTKSIFSVTNTALSYSQLMLSYEDNRILQHIWDGSNMLTSIDDMKEICKIILDKDYKKLKNFYSGALGYFCHDEGYKNLYNACKNIIDEHSEYAVLDPNTKNLAFFIFYVSSIIAPKCNECVIEITSDTPCYYGNISPFVKDELMVRRHLSKQYYEVPGPVKEAVQVIKKEDNNMLTNTEILKKVGASVSKNGSFKHARMVANMINAYLDSGDDISASDVALIDAFGRIVAISNSDYNEDMWVQLISSCVIAALLAEAEDDED